MEDKFIFYFITGFMGISLLVGFFFAKSWIGQLFNRLDNLFDAVSSLGDNLNAFKLEVEKDFIRSHEWDEFKKSMKEEIGRVEHKVDKIIDSNYERRQN